MNAILNQELPWVNLIHRDKVFSYREDLEQTAANPFALYKNRMVYLKNP
jgi:hypothetical protein